MASPTPERTKSASVDGNASNDTLAASSSTVKGYSHIPSDDKADVDYQAGKGPSSPRGYKLIPTDDDAADDVTIRPSADSTREEDHGSDDEDRYTINDPLLSRSAREPVRLGQTRRSSRFAACIKRSLKAIRLPSFRTPSFRTKSKKWGCSMKTSKKLRILKWTILALLVTVVALAATVTGLAVRLSKMPHRVYLGYPSSAPQSFLPLFQKRWPPSSHNRLNFPETYPPLTKASDLSCRAAWETLKNIPCHEKIWNRSWDNGKYSLFDPEIKYYASPICEPACQDRLKVAYQLVNSKCGPDDKFNKNSYSSPLSADSDLEDGPVAALETILRRLDHTCRRPPPENQWDWNRSRYQYYQTQQQFCTARIYQDWSIVDGMNAGNLEGLDMFSKLTAVNRTLSRNQNSYWPGNYWGFDNAREVQSSEFAYKDRHLGPGAGETDCGWCMLDWFERKIMSWKKGEVFDPKSGEPVELEEYIDRIKTMGSRCEVDDWNRIYKKALAHYKSHELLSHQAFGE